MIYYFKPFSTEKNLGKAYNDYMALLPNDDDWACMLDGDVMFLLPNYGQQLEDAIKANPNAGMLTCYTNRVGQTRQCYQDKISDDPNILNHKAIAKKLEIENKGKVKVLNHMISGYFMMIKKSTWNKIKFAEIPNKMLTIDNRISRDICNAGLSVLLLEDVYVFHFYRFDTGIFDKTHLK